MGSEMCIRDRSGAGAEVEQLIGVLKDFAIVFDHDDGVAEVAEFLECVQQSAVVSRVQADGGFVQHVQHAGEGSTDLTGQADALALAAGQTGHAAVERQVVQADVDEERESVDGFVEQIAGDALLFFVEFCLLYTSPSPRDLSTSRMPSSA